MKILAVDSALTACSATIVENGNVLAERCELRDRGHAEVMIPMIENARADAGLAYTDLDLVAVTVGPGSFTGIRVGVAAARGIALASALPTVGVTTLAALAARAASNGGNGERIVSVIDARRAEAYVQLFDAAAGIARPISAPSLESVSSIAEDLDGQSGILVGSGAATLLAVLPHRDRWRSLEILVPDGKSIASCAWPLAQQLHQDSVPIPLYIRKPDTNRPPRRRGR